MKSKSFVTNEIKKWNYIDLFFIIGIILYKFFSEGVLDWSQDFTIDAGILVFLLEVIAVIFVLIVDSMPYIVIYIGIRYSIKKYAKYRATFYSELNLEYYRDILDGFTPAEISLVMDLKTERKKDLSAMKLYYDLNDIRLYEKDFKLYVNNPQKIKLNKSDEILLNYFYYNKADNYLLNDWQENVISEAVNNNLIKKKNNNMNSAGSGRLFLISFIAFALGLWLALPMHQHMQFLEEINRQSASLSSIQIFEIISSKPENIFNFFLLILMGTMVFIFIGSFLVGIINSFVSHFVSKKNDLKRTKEGNLLAEKIYGLKNFIHEFSNLNEATKEHLVLWEEFLIYAVVLEENDIILDEISKLYNIDLLKYR